MFTHRLSDTPRSPARDAFHYLLLFVTLTSWVCALGSLLFVMINKHYPDMQTDGYFNLSDQIHWQMAILIISLPVFLWTAWCIEKNLRLHPELFLSRVRQWIGYFIVFVAANTFIWDLITLLHDKLEGSSTTPSVLKMIVVLVLSGGVLGYYSWDLRRTTAMRAAMANEAV